MRGQPQHYLPNEVNLYRELVATFTKYEGLECIHELELIVLIGNCMAFNNPYFIEWKIPVFIEEFYKQVAYTPTGKRIVRLIQNDKFDEELKDAKLNSSFGALNKSSAYGAYFSNNESLAENNDFILSKFGGYGLYNFYYRGYTLTLYTNNLILYFSDKVNRTLKTYYITREDNTYNTLSFFGNKYLKDALKASYQSSSIYYSSPLVKGLCYEIFNLINID